MARAKAQNKTSENRIRPALSVALVELDGGRVQSYLVVHDEGYSDVTSVCAALGALGDVARAAGHTFRWRWVGRLSETCEDGQAPPDLPTLVLPPYHVLFGSARVGDGAEQV